MATQLCVQGKRIGSNLVCLAESKQSGSKKITTCSFLANIEYKPPGNVCKTIRQKIHPLFYYIKSAVTCK